jgi:hypothetical protein
MQSGISSYKHPTTDSSSSIHQENGHARLQTMEIYVANSNC